MSNFTRDPPYLMRACSQSSGLSLEMHTLTHFELPARTLQQGVGDPSRTLTCSDLKPKLVLVSLCDQQRRYFYFFWGGFRIVPI